PKRKGGKGEGDRSRSEGSPRGDREDEDEDGAVLSPGQERVLEAVLWAATVSMVHLMLDVLVQHQYAVEIDLARVAVRTGQAFLGTYTLPSSGLLGFN